MDRFGKWFKGLSTRAKWLFIGAAIMVPLAAIGAASPHTTTKPISQPTTSTPAPKSETKTEIDTVTIPCGHKTVNDSTLEEGTSKTTQKCVDGEETQTYEVTYVDGVQTDKQLVSEKTKKEPVDEIIAEGTKPKPSPVQATTCDPNYTPCIPYHGGADYDCTGGSGNGPYYVQGPVYIVPGGYDVYGLDRDGNGVGCE